MPLLKIIILLPFTLSLLLSGAAYSQGWIKYENLEDQFVVNFPGDPEVIESDYVTESGATIPARIYSTQSNNSQYAIAKNFYFNRINIAFDIKIHHGTSIKMRLAPLSVLAS